MSSDRAKLPVPVAPSRGVKAGIKNDHARAQTAKLTGTSAAELAAAGVGVAYSHNFLNQKPWHPLNFRNQIKKFEAEVNQHELAKAREKGLAEFEAEQEYMKTLSYLSAADQQRYRERQSISFMYMKPPGLEAALARDAEEEAKKLAIAAAAAAVALRAADPSLPAAPAGAPESAPGPNGDGRQQRAPPDYERMQVMEKLREDPFAHMLTARQALQDNTRLRLKHGDSSPVHGGYDRGAGNQEYLVDDDDNGPGPHGGARGGPAGPSRGHPGDDDEVDLDDEAALLAALPEEDRPLALKQIRKIKKQREKERQLREAEAVLLAAGYDLGSLGAAGGGGGGGKESKKRKRKSKEKDGKEGGKKHKKHKKQHGSGREPGGGAGERRGGHDSSSSSD